MMDIVTRQFAEDPITIVMSVLVAFIAFIWLYYENKYASMKKMYNLPGPRPWPIVGNILQYFRYSRPSLSVLWREKYGKVSIHFTGLTPHVIIGDREVYRQICTKDFDYMTDHDFQASIVDKCLHNSIFFQGGIKWKSRRALLSPTFTSAKMKRMYKIMNICANDLVDCIGEQLDAHEAKFGCLDGFVMNSKNTYSLYSIDGIASCCYAIKLGREKGKFSIAETSKPNSLFRHLLNIFRVDISRVITTFLLPKFLLRFLGENSTAESFRKISRTMQHIMESRKEGDTRYDDYIQILINANTPDQTLDLSKDDESENHHVNHSSKTLIDEHEKIKRAGQLDGTCTDELSREELISNAVVLMVVGLETTALSLTAATYCLAHYPRIQDKLHEALTKIAVKSETSDKYDFDYTALSSCEYLDAVVSESLRLLSPAVLTDRVVNTDYRIEKYNTTLPKGTHVLLDIHSIHRDPDNWPEPEKFDPERFMPENRHKILPGSYTPFGQGPRHCLAMRFTLAETKLAIAKLVMAYTFIAVKGSKFPPICLPSSSNLYYDMIDVSVNRRL